MHGGPKQYHLFVFIFYLGGSTMSSPLNSGQLSAKADLKADLKRLQVSSKKLS